MLSTVRSMKIIFLLILTLAVIDISNANFSVSRVSATACLTVSPTNICIGDPLNISIADMAIR